MRELYCLGVPQGLPPLHTLWPGLRCLEVVEWADSAALPRGWVEQLRELKHLQTLAFPVPESIPDEAPQDVPSLPALTSLRITGSARAHVDLSKLPKLEELVFGGYGRAIVDGAQAGPQPCRLRKLELLTPSSIVNFTHMGALRFAWLQDGVEGTANLGAAMALQVLRLGGLHVWSPPEDYDLRQPWALNALRHVPPSLRLLALCGEWGEEEVGAILDMGQLRALSLIGPGGEGGPPSPRLAGEGRLWRSLRALRWDCYSNLPEEIAQATQLEVLHCSWCDPNYRYGGWVPVLEDLSPLLSLPALRRLGVLSGFAPYPVLPAGLREQIESARQLQGMPSLEVFCKGWREEEAEFIHAALPLLE